MRNILKFTGVLLILVTPVLAQNSSKDKEQLSEEYSKAKPTGVEDRAGGTHNASNIGLFFENRGKLYPRRITQGPSGEFPIGSGKNYVYRINPYVGIPSNVIQGRFTTNEEWEAVGGYHNREYAKIAFSDNPASWNADLGWPVKDASANPVVKSDQDSYCVYNDANNTVTPIGITIYQTGYAYGVKFAQNLLFYKFELVNNSTKALDSVYFAMYCDIDIGDISGGLPEYEDDRLDFDKENNFVYFFDDGFSDEWTGGITGLFGVAILETPMTDDGKSGITDMHYNLYDDDRDDDSLQYAILSSNPGLVNPPSLIPKYFHTTDDLHYDDPATIPASGLDLTATLSSGPYHLESGDTLVFYTVMVAGNNKADLYASLQTAQKIKQYNFEISKPPTTPTLSAYAGDGRITFFWNDVAELSKDNYTGEYDFEGYRLYRSTDKGLHWDQWDRNVDPSVGIDPIPLTQFDLKNDFGLDTGLQYSFTDTNVYNGFEYWYTLTAYDRGDASTASLESPRGNSPDALNTVSVTPQSKATGRIPVLSDTVHHLGRGKSNYVLNVQPIDQDSLQDREYQIKFTYTQRTTHGTLRTRIVPLISDSTKTEAKNYGIEFISGNSIHLVDFSTGDYMAPDPHYYLSGITYKLNNGMRIRVEDPDPDAEPQFLPKAGDQLTFNYAVYAIRNNQDTVIAPQPFLIEKSCATSDGVIFSLEPPDMIQNVSRIGGTDILNLTFAVADQAQVTNNSYWISVIGNGTDNDGYNFASLLLTSQTGDSIVFDTLYNAGIFKFAGIQGRISFPEDTPPAPGNAFMLETVIPVAPNLLDAYQFKIKGAVVRKLQLQDQLNLIRVVPNPYLVASLYEPEFGELRREPLRQIQFINLPQECTIYIFTIAGDLVKTIKHNAPMGTEKWDLRAEGGREIASGVYLYVVKTVDAQYKNTFAVIK
jgi:hypothetical protein